MRIDVLVRAGLAGGGAWNFPFKRRRRSARLDPSPEKIEVDVAARQHEPDLASLETRSLLHRRRERRRARSLGEVVRISPIGAHRRRNLVVADQRDPRRAFER